MQCNALMCLAMGWQPRSKIIILRKSVADSNRKAVEICKEMTTEHGLTVSKEMTTEHGFTVSKEMTIEHGLTMSKDTTL